MATNTPILGLRKPDGADLVNYLADLDDNFDKIDAAVGINLTPVNRVKVATVATLETRANAAYAALATAQSLTITPGPSGLLRVTVSCGLNSGTVGGAAMMSYALSGGNVKAAGDDSAFGFQGQSSTLFTAHGSRTFLHVGMAAVLTTVTAMFRSNGVDVASFLNRQLIVEAL